MADYYTPTVVQPTIPNADMTSLERLLLMQIFESEPDDDGLYFFAEITPADQIELPIETLRNALADSDSIASQAATFVIDRLKDAGGDCADIELDLSVTSWEFILQDIVKRSATLDTLNRRVAIQHIKQICPRSEGVTPCAVETKGHCPLPYWLPRTSRSRLAVRAHPTATGNSEQLVFQLLPGG